MATNDAGSVFEGVILPRSETLDDQHVVIKLKTGYNVGPARGPGPDDGRGRLQGGLLQDPGEGVPVAAAPADGDAARHRRHDRLAPRLPHGRGDPGLHPRRALRRGAGAGRPREPHHEEALRRLLREHGEGAVRGPGRGHRPRRSRPGSTASSSATAPTPWATPPRSCPSWSRTRRCRSSWWARSARATGRRATPRSTSSTRCARRAAARSPRSRSACSARPRTSTRLLHRGTRCRKMHSSYRSTFRTIGDIPLAMVGEDFTYLSDDFRAPRPLAAGAGRHGLRGPDDDPLLLPGHEARPRGRARREGLPRDRHRRHRPRPRQQAALPGAPARGRGRRPRGDDGADALGLRPDVRLRHRARPPRPRHRAPRQHAARRRRS